MKKKRGSFGKIPRWFFFPGPKKAVGIPHLSPSKMTQLQLLQLLQLGCESCRGKDKCGRNPRVARWEKPSTFSPRAICVLLRMNFWLFNGGLLGGMVICKKSGHTYCKCSKNSHGLHMVFFCLSCMTPSGGAFDL